jgi:hypothetical protein
VHYRSSLLVLFGLREDHGTRASDIHFMTPVQQIVVAVSRFVKWQETPEGPGNAA